MKILIVSIVLGCFASSLYAGNVTIVADDWCPYTCDPKSGQDGYIIDIAREVFKSNGYYVVYKLMNWSRAKDECRHGSYDAIAGAYKNDAPDFVFPNNDIGQSAMSFFVRKDNKWRYEGLDSLSDLKIGIINNYSYGEILDPYFKSRDSLFSSCGANAIKNNIEKLVEGMVDVIVDDENVIMINAKQLKLESGIIYAGSVDNGEAIYIAFSPKHEISLNYSKILSDGIEELRKNGRLDQIMSRYGLQDWKRPDDKLAPSIRPADLFRPTGVSQKLCKRSG